MKLGELRAAIRAEKNPTVTVFGMRVAVQKGSLIDALGEKYGSKSAETDLVFKDGRLGMVGDSFVSGFSAREIVVEGHGSRAPADPRQIDLEEAIAAAQPVSGDLDDLL